MADKQIIVIDSQRLDAIESCMFQYKLKFGSLNELGVQPRVVPDYFERGGLLHDMLEEYYKLKYYRSRWATNNKTHQDIVRSCVNVGRYKATKMQLDIAEIESVIATFMQYTDHWENDGWNDIIAVEKVGSKILYENNQIIILYEVKIDLILRIAGKIQPVDHKSAKARRDPNSLSNQFRGYCWFLDTNYLIQNEIGFQKTLKPIDKFRRHVLSFSDNQIREWKENATYWILHAVSLMQAGAYPQNFTSCDKYSGCIFKPTICMSDPDVRLFKINQFFEARTWDVGEKGL